MLDLALQFGMPFETLQRTMSERELRIWDRRARERGLPTQRIEWHLAQIAMVLARVFGSKDAKLKDFLIEPAREDEGLDGLKSAFDFKPRKKRGTR